MPNPRKDRGPAWLPSTGLNERRATLHRFAGEAHITENKDGREEIVAVAQLYQCDETGAIRRWGYDAHSQPTKGIQ